MNPNLADNSWRLKPQQVLHYLPLSSANCQEHDLLQPLCGGLVLAAKRSVAATKNSGDTADWGHGYRGAWTTFQQHLCKGSLETGMLDEDVVEGNVGWNQLPISLDLRVLRHGDKRPILWLSVAQGQ